MTDDTTTDGPEEPTVNDDDEQAPHDADQPDGADDSSDDDTDVPELRARLAEAEADAARYKRRLLASDLRKKQVERELRDSKTTRTPAPKTDGEQTNAAQPDDAIERELADLRRQVQDSKVRTAFDGYGKHQWQNPNAAWRLLDLSEIRNDDGTVDSDDLHDAVDALARAEPWLTKTTTPVKVSADRPTGQQPGTTRKTVKPDFTSTMRSLRGRI